MHATVVSVLLISASLSQIPRYAQPRPGQPRVAQPATQQRFYGHGPVRKEEMEQQQQAFKQWWGDELVVKLADLPAEGKVPEFRVPYCGHDYPDLSGGTMHALSKYDQAFHRGRGLATEYERMDVSAHRGGRLTGRNEPVRGGLFARLRANADRNRVPTWYGHCNGWTAAAIRHAEPQKSVVRNGVTFTPADIKGLLAEMYMYSESVFLGGVDPAINPAVLHLTLSNWIGRGSHPVGMETAVGEVVINFPVFNYKSTLNELNSRETEVKTTITYALNINREQDKGPSNYHRAMAFHYVLDTDDNGEILGGRFYGDSQQIDMLWTPLQPAQGGQPNNRRGNPHMDIKEVLAIWRESVPEDLRKQWLNIDPTEEDRVLPPSEAVAAVGKPDDSAGTAIAASESSEVAGADDAAGATTAATATTAADSTTATAEAATGAASAATEGSRVVGAGEPVATPMP